MRHSYFAVKLFVISIILAGIIPEFSSAADRKINRSLCSELRHNALLAGQEDIWGHCFEGHRVSVLGYFEPMHQDGGPVNFVLSPFQRPKIQDWRINVFSTGLIFPDSYSINHFIDACFSELVVVSGEVQMFSGRYMIKVDSVTGAANDAQSTCLRGRTED